MHINGYNPFLEWERHSANNYSSRYLGVWDWVTCCRAWKHYDSSWLRLDTFLEREVSRTVSAFRDNTIGLHIRRGDNPSSIQYCPLEEFLSVLDDEVIRDDKVQFYLAKDCTQTEHDLRIRFREKILSRKREFRHDRSQGIKDALIRMVYLSKTRKIYRSYCNSFSGVAAQIRQGPFQVILTPGGDKP